MSEKFPYNPPRPPGGGWTWVYLVCILMLIGVFALGFCGR